MMQFVGVHKQLMRKVDLVQDEPLNNLAARCAHKILQEELLSLQFAEARCVLLGAITGTCCLGQRFFLKELLF